MPNFQVLRESLNEQQRSLLDEIWKHFLLEKNWPVAWEFHSPNRKKLVRDALKNIGGNAVFENHDSQHGSRYQLTLLGVLLTSDWEQIESLLVRYLEFLRKRYQSQPKNRIVLSSEAQTELCLDDEETKLLGRLVILGNLYGSSASYSSQWDSKDWQAGILQKVEDFPSQGNLGQELENLTLIGFKTDKPVFLDENPIFNPGFISPTTPEESRRNNEASVDPLKRRYQVFVSSTYEDLKEERRYVMHALLEHKCIPTGMELFPAASKDQWTLIKRIIDDCDYYIVIIAGRYGSIGTGGKSYTEMEFDYAVSSGKSVISFCHSDTDSLVGAKLEKSEIRQQQLAVFTEKVKKRICKYWNTPDGLASAIKSAILYAIEHDLKPGWIRAADLPSAAAIASLKDSINRESKKTEEKKGVNETDIAKIQTVIGYYEADQPKQTRSLWSPRKTASHTFTVSLNELFSMLAPRAKERRSYKGLKARLVFKLLKSVQAIIPKRDGKFIVGCELKIDDNAFQGALDTFVVQKILKSVSPPKNLTRKAPYWEITAKGLQRLAEIRASTRS